MKYKNLTSGIAVLLISMVTCLMIACSDEDDDSSITEPLQIKSFTISPGTGHVGDQFLFSWETTGAEQISIEPAISEQDLSSSGSLSVEVIYSTWYTLTAQAGESEMTARAWVQVSYPEGSNWSCPRADTSNSAFSHWPGPSNGTLKWSFPFNDIFGDARYITLAGDESVRVSLHSDHQDGGYMIALNPDGSLKFEKYGPLSQQVIGSSLITYGSGSDRKMLKAFNPDGSLKWEKNMGPNYANILRNREIYVYQQDKLFLYEMAHQYMQDHSRLLIVNKDGDIDHIANQDYFYYGFALNCDSSVVYTSVGGWLVCLNDRLEQMWVAQHKEFVGRPMTDTNCRTYCTFGEGNGTYGAYATYGMMALDNQGQEIWRVYYPESTRSVYGSRSARSDNALYVVLNDTSASKRISLCAIDFEGTLLWTTSFDGDYFSCELAVDSNDCTYVSTSGHIYSFYNDGTLRWQVYYPDEYFQSLTLSRNGTLYAAGERQLYAFGD